MDTNIIKENHSLFLADNGEEKLYQHDNLNDNSIVFDLGFYNGEFSDRIYNLYKSNIYAFDPVKEYYDKYSNKNVKKFNFALGSEKKTSKLYINGNRSSFIFESNTYELVKSYKFCDFTFTHKINKIDLLKINIEGEEYSLLEYLLNQNIINYIDNILVQFHIIDSNSNMRRQKIVDQLISSGFKIKWSYPFIWEYYAKNI